MKDKLGFATIDVGAQPAVLAGAHQKPLLYVGNWDLSIREFELLSQPLLAIYR